MDCGLALSWLPPWRHGWVKGEGCDLTVFKLASRMPMAPRKIIAVKRKTSAWHDESTLTAYSTIDESNATMKGSWNDIPGSPSHQLPVPVSPTSDGRRDPL